MPLDARELSRRLKKLNKSLKGFSKDPTVEEVHDLRTRTRRVESILGALGINSAGNEKKLLSELKSIRSRAGKVRDMDVLTSDVVGLGLSEEPDCVVRLVHHLGYERHRHARKLHSVVGRHSTELARRLKSSRRKLTRDVERALKSQAKLDGNANQEESLLHATSVALRLLEELRSVPRLGPDNLHSYRIEVKRLRYVLEMAGEDEGEQKNFIEELKRTQDAIGEWHDWLELTDIAQNVLQHDKSCNVVQTLESTAQTKFKEALRIAEQMRHRYLPPATASKKTQGSKRKRSDGLPGPVLVAASEMLA